MTKYRIRLANGRVIGPFIKNQLHELKLKGHIKGNEEAQVYPTGDWGPIHLQDFYAELMDENATAVISSTSDDTFVIDLTKIREAKNSAELEKHDISRHQPFSDLTETVRMATTGRGQAPKIELEYEDDSPPELSLNTDLKNIAADTEWDKTLINPIAQQEIALMRRQQLQEEERKAMEAKKKVQEEAQALVIREQQEIPVADQNTQMFSLDTIDHLLLAAKQEEKVIAKELKSYKKKKAAEEGLYIQDSQEEEDEEELLKHQKTKKLIFMIAVLALAYALLFPGETKPVQPAFVHIQPQIIFPQPFDQADTAKSQIEFDKGMEFFLNGTYPDIIRAGILFKSSYEQDMENLQALSFLARAYGEQLQSSKRKLADAHTFFNILRGKRPFLVADPNGIIGVNLFYMAIQKPEAAADVTAKFIKHNDKAVSPDLFAAHMMSLIELGKIDDDTRLLYQRLVGAPYQTRYTLEALIKYSYLNQEIEKAEEYINDGIKRFPHLAKFYILKAEWLMSRNRFSEVMPLLQKVNELKLESNDFYRGKLLELQGLLLAEKGDVKNATQLLTASLKIQDSTELRMKLAGIDKVSGEEATDKLIAESKAINHLLVAKQHLRKKNYELALSNAAKAVDTFPAHIASVMFLSKVQLKLGLAAKGVKTLEELEARYMDNPEITLALIDAYTETFKFNQAKNKIAKLAQSEMKNTHYFAAANGKLFLRMGDTLQAMSWFRNAINLNPISDSNMFHMAQLLIRRANFEAARNMLNKCIELDPSNPEYRIAYSKIVYETQDDQAAVGYLLGLLEDFVDNPQILAEIAIFYYRAGKVKDFEAFKTKIEKIPFKDKALYEFLIKAAQLDERYDDIPGYVEKLLEIEPGALDAMMTAGRTMFETGKLIEAAKWFRRIQEKMPGYPKVHYYIARITFMSGDTERALQEVEADIKANGETDTTLILKAQIYAFNEQYVEAENLYKKSQKLNARSYEALVGLADISTKRNNFDLALDLYKRAMKEKGDEPILHKKVGDVYRLLGQGALAMESYKMYLELSPEASDKGQIDAYIKLMQ